MSRQSLPRPEYKVTPMSKETKRYRLLKDIQTMDLTAKAGDIGIQKPSEFYDESCKVWFDNGRYFYYLSQIKQYPEWFELIPEQSKELNKGSERIEISNLVQHDYTNKDSKYSDGYWYQFKSTKPMWHISNSKVKQALEKVLNGGLDNPAPIPTDENNKNEYIKPSPNTLREGKDWEIVSVLDDEGNAVYFPSTDVLDGVLKNGGERIYEVKRLSDNEVFSCKEKTLNGTIKEFIIQNDGSMYVQFDSNYGESLTWLKKSPETLTNTVTDNSDVACLSLNDLLDVWDGGNLTRDFKSHYKDSPLYKLFEQKVKEKLKK